MAGMPWIKLYTEILDDVKMSRLSDSQKWRFIQILLLAGECDAAGAIVTGDTPVSHDEICWRLRCDSQTLSQDIEKLVELGLISMTGDVIEVTKFSDRQGPTQTEKREKWQIRQQAHRNKVKNTHVTSESRVSHDTEEERREKREEEDRDDSALDFIPTPCDSQALGIYRGITGYTTFPATERNDIITAIQSFLLSGKNDAEVINYCKPFFIRFKEKYPGSTKSFWITEWAVQNTMPEKGNGNNGNGKYAKTAKEEGYTSA